EYIAVGSGDCGTDDCPPLITAESPLDMTLFWDARARVATAALGACAFCKMLAVRGAVYERDTANFRAHDGCHCGVVPIFR
ncbi:hypothetical protein KBZ21_41300, partial [Streptomyces sp. A73]|nr:hypothetical protein [Streptomyces sp. A73]